MVVVMVLTGDGLAMRICLPGVTGCLLIGLKWVNSVSIELLLSLLQLLLLLLATGDAAPGDVAATGVCGWLFAGGGWNREEGEKVMLRDEVVGGMNKEEA